MTIAFDRDLDGQTLVNEELAWTPEVDAAGIGVAVEDGTVTLSGEVDTYAERLAAKHAALRVRGVRAVVDNLNVHPKTAMSVTLAARPTAADTEERIKNAFVRNARLDAGHILPASPAPRSRSPAR